jgi:hypothetical protein
MKELELTWTKLNGVTFWAQIVLEDKAGLKGTIRREIYKQNPEFYVNFIV